MPAKATPVLAPQINLPEMEREILAFWDKQEIFHKSLSARAGAPLWTFYEGPPTANGLPGTHHIEARVFKDLFPRFHTMKGKSVPRRAGWDCHGLPVEIAVEKELGLNGKSEIEKIAPTVEESIIEFNDRCRASVLRHVDAFTNMTKRMGFWVDFEEAYWTMSSEYIESVWWALSEIFNKKLLVQDHRVAPYCPRCGTGLSDHELAQGYETVTDPSVFVKFPLTEGKYAGANLLVWTTTPWTLISNTAVAYNPEVDYVLVEVEANGIKEQYIVAEKLISVIDRAYKKDENISINIKETFLGENLSGLHYQRPFNSVELDNANYLIPAEYVTTEDGSGLVHLAPAFGAEDFQACRKFNLPVVNPLMADGHFEPHLDLIGGEFFKDADKKIVRDLKERGLLFFLQNYQHSYPHCWRCHTPLIYYAQPSWYIRTTEIKDSLIRENQKTDWHPETIKDGRFGDWLNNNIDWALSRNRYWGTPLPIWKCENKHYEAISSLAQLSERSGKDCSTLDPHRPYVDSIAIDCKECGEQMLRVPEVIDCWFDSGSMPFAQLGFPHKAGSKELFDLTYPADFICEAIDQTRGWFYTLMTIGTLLFDKSSYETVLCLGHILDKDGRKMSKHLGNVLEPIPLMDQHGADAVRWYMLAAGSPWSARRVGHDAIQEVVRKTLLTYWNTLSFFTLYANASGYSFESFDPSQNDLSMMDKWILSELHQTIAGCDAAYENFDSQAVGKLIAQFIDDLSNWYIRRNRRRFWDGDKTALDLLYYSLKQLSLLMAPMVPFITEHYWQELVRKSEPNELESIHLALFPTSDSKLIDSKLISEVRLARRLVELGRAARAESKIKIRQPLSRALIAAQHWNQISPERAQELISQISEELNVMQVEEISGQGSDLVDTAIKANFRTLGARFGGEVQAIAKAIAAADAATLVKTIRESGKANIAYEGGECEITIDDLVITETPRSGWSFASQTGESVALDLTLTPELLELGLLREIIRFVQDQRKANNFDVSDRIKLEYHGTTEIDSIFEKFAETIKSETLATSIVKIDSQLTAKEEEIGLSIQITVI